MRQQVEVDPTTPSQKQRILGLMAERSANRTTARGVPNKRKGYVGMTVIEVSETLGISPHDVTHALYDLQKQGLVGFKESKSMGRAIARGSKDSKGGTPYSAVPVKLRITEKGVNKVNTKPDLDENYADVPEPMEPVEEDTPPPERTPDPDPVPTVDIDAEVTSRIRERLDTEAATALDAIEQVLDSGVSDLPNIVSLMERTSKVRQAATLLREAGQDDLADLVQTEQQALSGLERDVLTLLDRLGIE